MASYYKEEYDGISIVEYEDFSLDKPSYLVLGLPDTGLVGPIAASHMVKTLGLREVGGIESDRFLPPVVVVHKGVPRTPLRLFAGDNVLVLVSETALSPASIFPLAYALVDYARKRGVDYLVSLLGMGVPNRLEIKKPKAYWLANTEAARKAAEALGVEQFIEGFLVGPYAVILREATRRRVNNIVLISESFLDFPDPEAAAVVLEEFSKLVGREIDVKPLLEEAELIRIKTRELMRSTQKALEKMQKGYEHQVPLLYT